jgi:hypothetical protein
MTVSMRDCTSVAWLATDLAQTPRERKCAKCALRVVREEMEEVSGDCGIPGRSSDEEDVAEALADFLDRNSRSKTKISDYYQLRSYHRRPYFVCPVLRLDLRPAGGHQDKVLFCDAQLLCDPSFELRETTSDTHASDIRVDIVRHVERPPSVRRVYSQVHR